MPTLKHLLRFEICAGEICEMFVYSFAGLPEIGLRK